MTDCLKSSSLRHLPLPSSDGWVSICASVKPSLNSAVYLNFSHHATQIKTKIRKRNNILKALVGTTWGASKEVMLTAYKAICRPILNYAAPVWTPALSDTQWKELQTCQNSALRTATGCHLMSSIDHLHAESMILPVRRHNELLSRQFLLGAHLPDRPDNFVTKPPDRARTRPIRRTLKSKRGHSIEDLVPSGGLSWEGYRAGLKSIHQTGVTEVLQSYQPNIVLGGTPTTNKHTRAKPATINMMHSGPTKIRLFAAA